MTTEEKLNVLSDIAEKINKENIVWGIGASLLLYFKGIADHFNDIDIMVMEEDAYRLKELLLSMGELQPPNPKAIYKTRQFYEFVIDDVDVDVTAGFVIVKDGIDYDCSFTKNSIAGYIDVNGQSVPLQKVSEWLKFYELMGRDSKVKMIKDWMSEA